MRHSILLTSMFALAACNGGREGTDDPSVAEGITVAASGIDGGDPSGLDGDAADDDGEKLDVGGTGGVVPCPEGQVCDDCVDMSHEPCDDGTDLFNAIGLNCPGTPPVIGTVDGSPAAIGMRTGFGSTGEWNPREGSKFAVIGSGFVGDLDMPTPQGDDDNFPSHCNDDVGSFDPGGALPAPLRTNDVGGDCVANEGLLGTGDCSNTVAAQFNQGMIANDYTEMRIVASVPPGNNSISYDFAFFSVEYPIYYGDVFNDMYVGWLESESWTGNISFDEQGNPISLNAGFLDFRDDGGGIPEFAGTCMARHAGTKWLSSTAPVTPGEEITVVFAVFDLADSILDSYVFLDNFQWGCEGTDHPMTTPVG
jgi:hypothetical protein